MYCMTEFGVRSYTLRMVYTFDNVHQLMAWYAFNNPARQKFLNILEKEISAKADDKTALWATLCHVIQRALKHSSNNEIRAFTLYYTSRAESRMGVADIALELGVSPRTIRRYLNDIVDEIERISINMRILPPNPENNQK